jgi:predicted nucleic acid-binding protein
VAAPSALLDTGAIVAILDERDRWHEACVDAWSTLRFPVATSAAVLTELFHLLGDEPDAVRAAWRLLRSGVVKVLPIDDADLPALDALMERYAHRPMDFADATLVHLARRESLSTILTVDDDDFETYRIDGRKRFRVLPGRLLAEE